MKTLLEILALLFLAFVATLTFSFVTAWIVMLLWNWLMPLIFGLTVISFWQAFGLMILFGMLFGGIKFNYTKSE